VEIKQYKKGDEKNILELFKLSFNQVMSIDYWKWRFIDNPIGTQMIYLMWDNNTLVGHYAVSPTILKLNGETICQSALSMTTMTHPEYGGKGIFTKLASSLYETEYSKGNLDIVWGFPNRFSHRGFIKNLGWKNVTVIPNFSLDLMDFRHKESSSDQFRKIDEINDKHVSKRNELISDYKVTVEKDVQYYKWRYNLNPIVEYSIFGDNDNNFFIIKEFRNGITSEIDILEWSVLNDFSKMKDAINTIISHFEKNGVSVKKLNFWLPINDKNYIDFEKLGFVNRENLTFMGFKNLNPKFSIANLEWLYQMGDSDVY